MAPGERSSVLIRLSPGRQEPWSFTAEGVYDALDGNDRLLLGMKIAMGEYELIAMRNRLLRGSRNRAERGELSLAVPLGYLKTTAGEVIQEPVEQARGMIRLVFEEFDILGSAYAVFRYRSPAPSGRVHGGNDRVVGA